MQVLFAPTNKMKGLSVPMNNGWIRVREPITPVSAQIVGKLREWSLISRLAVRLEFIGSLMVFGSALFGVISILLNGKVSARYSLVKTENVVL